MLHKDGLTSAFHENYTLLQNLLASGKLREANQETRKIMLHVSGRQKKGWLRVEDIDNIPEEDLYIIDQLWENYSEGRFGFSRQAQIWQTVGGSENSSYETYCLFGDRVGWRVNGSWLSYADINYNLNAPPGHLPSVYPAANWGWLGRLLCRWLVSSLMSKFADRY